MVAFKSPDRVEASISTDEEQIRYKAMCTELYKQYFESESNGKNS